MNYKLLDGLFSRLRYWSEPFSIVFADGEPKAVPDSELPVMLAFGKWGLSTRECQGPDRTWKPLRKLINENAGADAIARVEETLDWVLNDKDRREDEYQDKIDDLRTYGHVSITRAANVFFQLFVFIPPLY